MEQGCFLTLKPCKKLEFQTIISLAYSEARNSGAPIRWHISLMCHFEVIKLPTLSLSIGRKRLRVNGLRRLIKKSLSVLISLLIRSNFFWRTAAEVSGSRTLHSLYSHITSPPLSPYPPLCRSSYEQKSQAHHDKNRKGNLHEFFRL